jgi:hypothetical protein
MTTAVLLYALVALGSETPLPDDIAIDVLSTLLAGSEVPCLSVDRNDPASAVLSALRNLRPDVLPASHCYYAGPDNNSSKAKTASGSPAEFLDVSNFVSASPQKGILSIWRRAGSWQGHGSKVQIERREGHWVVTETISNVVE